MEFLLSLYGNAVLGMRKGGTVWKRCIQILKGETKMWIEDLTKALYFLNATDYRWTLLVRKITDNFIFFTDGSCARVQDLVKAYDNFIRTGEIAEIF